LSSIFKQPLLRNCAVDCVEICNVYFGKMIIKAAKRIFNSVKICRSYSDLNFGVTFLEHSVESIGHCRPIAFCVCDPILTNFGRTPTCNRRTDGQSQGHSIYRASTASRGKNWPLVQKIGRNWLSVTTRFKQSIIVCVPCCWQLGQIYGKFVDRS